MSCWCSPCQTVPGLVHRGQPHPEPGKAEGTYLSPWHLSGPPGTAETPAALQTSVHQCSGHGGEPAIPHVLGRAELCSLHTPGAEENMGWATVSRTSARQESSPLAVQQYYTICQHGLQH